MRILKILFIVIVVLVAAVIGVGMTLDSKIEVERSITIKAKAIDIFPYVNDLEKWPEWSPWEEDDPTIVTTRGDRTVSSRSCPGRAFSSGESSCQQLQARVLQGRPTKSCITPRS